MICFHEKECLFTYACPYSYKDFKWIKRTWWFPKATTYFFSLWALCPLRHSSSCHVCFRVEAFVEWEPPAWGLNVQTPLLTAVRVRGPTPPCHLRWGLPQLYMHVCEVEKLVWNLLLSFSKVHSTCLFPGPSDLWFLPYHQAKRDSQTNLLSSAQIQRKIKLSGKFRTWHEWRKGKVGWKKIVCCSKWPWAGKETLSWGNSMCLFWLGHWLG